MEQLKEGTYTLPPELKAIVRGGNSVVVMRRKPRPVEANVMRCRDCKHQQCGKKTFRSQTVPNKYCDARPKVIGGRAEYNYAAPDSKVACYKFEPKES